LSYNASVVKVYNATCSLERFKNKNIFFCFEKRCSLLQRWRCSCKFKSRRIGSWCIHLHTYLSPGAYKHLKSQYYDIYIHQCM
jgi:hypothetical protein